MPGVVLLPHLLSELLSVLLLLLLLLLQMQLLLSWVRGMSFSSTTEDSETDRVNEHGKPLRGYTTTWGDTANSHQSNALSGDTPPKASPQLQ